MARGSVLRVTEAARVNDNEGAVELRGEPWAVRQAARMMFDAVWLQAVPSRTPKTAAERLALLQWVTEIYELAPINVDIVATGVTRPRLQLHAEDFGKLVEDPGEYQTAPVIGARINDRLQVTLTLCGVDVTTLASERVAQGWAPFVQAQPARLVPSADAPTVEAIPLGADDDAPTTAG